MTIKHVCPRCGTESRCARRHWWDRHPFAAALFAVPSMFFFVGVVLAYPWFFVPLLIVVTGWWVDRRNRRRAATAARAEWEYRQEITQAVSEDADQWERDNQRRAETELRWKASIEECIARQEENRAAITEPMPTYRRFMASMADSARHVMGRWPTTPMQTKPIRTQR